MRDKGLRDAIIKKIDNADINDLIKLGVIFNTILIIAAAIAMFVFACHERQNCINNIIQQYSNAPIEELKQRIELCNI